jgi:prevent-host-death family protein
MLNEIGSYDAKTKLPEILRRVQAGETFTITNRGKAIAALIPSQVHNRSIAQAAIDGILKLKKTTISNAALLQLKTEGRK